MVGDTEMERSSIAEGMMREGEAAHPPGVSLAVVKGYVVATPQSQLSAQVIATLRDRLLNKLAVTNARHVYIDCSGLEVMDTDEFRALHNLAAMAKLLGADVLIGGLRPGVVASLVTMGEFGTGLQTVLNLDDAVSHFEEEIP